MAGSSPGSTGQDASVRSAMGRSISAASSPNSRSTASRAGRCWSGNAASRMPSRARAKARSSSAITSLRSRSVRSTISRPAVPISRPTGACWAFDRREGKNMPIEGRGRESADARIRLGMVGRGEGAFIGAVHRLAARMDDHYVLVAGALSSTPEKAQRSGKALGLAPDRIYDDFETMAREETKRPDGIEAVAIVTPNDTHAPASKAFLKAGIHVICDKPLTLNLKEALSLEKAVKQSGRIFALTHNYTGYPMARHARAMVKAGDLGEIRVVQVEYPQDWLTEKIEDTGHKQAAWRNDPKRAGAGGCLGDIGTHAHNIAAFVTGLELDSLSADLTSFVKGRKLDDNVHVMMRYRGGAKGMLWASQVAPGNENNLKLRVYGTK